ncbi:hypothetical protein NGB53_23335, partial [Escherichia coli]|nr:hypothetical protein [Escherichia coli]
VAYDAYLVGWYGTGVLNILAGGNASLTTITTSVIGANEDSEGLTLGVLLALSGSASGASLEVDNDQITNIDTDVAYDAYLVGW